jgi:hypothetical protein
MKAHVELKLDGKPKRIEFDMPEGAVRPAELLPVLRQFSNAMVEAAEAAATEPISCTKGCGACCRQLVPIREMEARRLAVFVRSLPEPRRSMILERFAAARAKSAGMRAGWTRAPGLINRGGSRSNWTTSTLASRAHSSKTNPAGIYEERPMICREHLVTTPAAWCATPREGTIRTLPMRRADSAAAKLEAGDWIPLIDLLDWVDEHPADEGALRDPREMLQAFLRDLAS